MEMKDVLTLTGVLITLVVGIASLINGLVTNKRTLYVNAITSERVKWMGQLKELLAEHLSLTALYDHRNFLQGAELNNYLERLTYLRNRIKLHLNPAGKKDRTIIRLIDRINEKIIMIYDYGKITSTSEEGSIERFEKILELLHSKFINDIEDKYWLLKSREKYNNANDEDKIELFNSGKERLYEILRKELGYKVKDISSKLSKELVELSSEYLKEEWERVKLESQNGRPLLEKVSKIKQGVIVLTIGIYLITAFLMSEYFSAASNSSRFILLFLIAYISFFPFLKQVLKDLNFKEEIRYMCLVLMEASLWLSSIAIISFASLFPTELTITEIALYICILLLLSLRNITKVLPRFK